jgi:hypothetical protein
MSFCIKCGNKIRETDTFCAKCGAEIERHISNDQETYNNTEVEQRNQTNDEVRGFREIDQSRAAVSVAAGIILFVGFLAVISLASDAVDPVLTLVSVVFDIFLSIFMLVGKHWARTWILIRAILGLVVFSAIFTLSNDYSSLFMQIGFCVPVIILLTGTSTQFRIWGSVILFIILYFVGYFYPAFDATIVNPASTELLSQPPRVTTSPTVPQRTSITEPAPTSTKELKEQTSALPTAIGGIPQSTEIISANYSWSYKGQEWSWEVKIPTSLYEYYRNLPRPPTGNYSVYVTHPLDDPYIDRLVEKIRNAAQKEGYLEYETVEFAAAFVQGLPYTTDSVTTPYDEYPRYPIETLTEKGGDCEDTSILLASIIDKMGFGTVLIVLPTHVGVGVKGGENMYGTRWTYKGERYYYIETTGENWPIGELPDEYKNMTASVYPMIPVPILTHDGSIQSRGYIVEVAVKVSNLGTAQAANITVFAGFDAGGTLVWNSQESEPFTLGFAQEATVTLNLRIPYGKHTRLIVQILVDNVLVDESYTEWFDT